MSIENISSDILYDVVEVNFVEQPVHFFEDLQTKKSNISEKD